MLLTTQIQPENDRRQAFAEVARRLAAGEVLQHPLHLDDHDRRLYVRQTLREDHRFRIHNRPEGAQRKFDELARSPVKLFRGTALLFYRDMVGSDPDLPQVFCIGDVHPENYGVMPNTDGVPFFGLNDFDEAEVAPFSWDVKRAALGFYMYSKANGFKKKQRRKVVRDFVSGYLAALEEFARDDRERHHQYRLDNSPKQIRKLIEGAMESRRSFLKDKIDPESGQFTPTHKVVPASSRIAEFQQAIKRYVKHNDIDNRSGRAGHFKVKDVALKKGSGTASLGLDRYWVLVDGETEDHLDDILLELKQARRSALWGLTPQGAAEQPQGQATDSEASRIANSHRVHLAGGDPYYGHATIGGESFLVRERSPFKDSIDVDDLDVDEMQDYAGTCGRALAQAHARADEDTGLEGQHAERTILQSVQPRVFVDDMIRFAVAATRRLERDYELFCADHCLGAFTILES